MGLRKIGAVSEAGEQRVLAQWLDLIGVLWCHVPNGGLRPKEAGVHMQQQGVRRGVPDILIFTPPPRRPMMKGVAIELKSTSKGSRLSFEQQAWLDGLEAVGWSAVMCRGADAAMEHLKGLGYGQP